MGEFKIIIADGHTHISTKGLGVSKICRKFKDAGGWFMALVSLPPAHYGLDSSIENIERAIELHAVICNKALKSGVKIACIAGVHPSFVDRLIRVYKGNEEKIRKLLTKLEDIVTVKLPKMINEGIVSGLGEFGRPHYSSIPESFAINNFLLTRALSVVKDYDVVIHLHLEQGGYATALSIDVLNKLIGARKSNVIFHHSSAPLAASALSLGYSITVVGKGRAIGSVYERCIKYADKVMIESDYIDDPKRPGVVMYPWEIREGVINFIENFSWDENALNFINHVMIDNIIKLYGVEPP